MSGTFRVPVAAAVGDDKASLLRGASGECDLVRRL